MDDSTTGPIEAGVVLVGDRRNPNRCSDGGCADAANLRRVRTTLDIDDAVLAAARALSSEAGLSLGAAVSELARRGLQPRLVDDAFPTFAVSADTAPMTPDMVREAMAE